MVSTKLNAKQQAILDHELAQPEHPDKRMSIWELIEQIPAQAERGYALLRPSYLYAGLPEEQVRLASELSEDAGQGIYMPGCLRGAICRRFTLDAPVELALRMAMAARFEWFASQTNRNTHPETHFGPLLLAASAHDFAAVDLIAQVPETALEKPNNRDFAFLLGALVGLVHGDEAKLQQAAEAMAKRRPSAHIKALQGAVIAIAMSSPEEFAAALKKMLKTYRNYMFGDDFYGLINPHAMGLYEMARRYRPQVVDAFDTSEALPWDAGYYAWLMTCDDIAVHFERERVPTSMRAHILDLEPLAWVPQFMATLTANQANAPDPKALLRSLRRANTAPTSSQAPLSNAD